MDDNHIEFLTYELPKTKSVSVRIGDLYAVGIDERAMEDSAEERTHLAHEIGHCMTGSFYEIGDPLYYRAKFERKADAWAVHKLMPWRSLYSAMRHGVIEPWEIAESYGVSEEFVRRAFAVYEREGRLPIRCEE